MDQIRLPYPYQNKTLDRLFSSPTKTGIGPLGLQPLYFILLLSDLRIRDVAAQVGVSYGAVQFWSVGHHLPRSHHRKRLSEVLGVPEHDLFLETET